VCKSKETRQSLIEIYFIKSDSDMAVKLKEGIDLHKHRLLLSSVSIGNVGQLCVDLIIFNAIASGEDCQLIGRIEHRGLLPLVGFDPYQRKIEDGNVVEPEWSQMLATACDIHLVSKHKLVVIQIRSDILKVFQKDLIESLVSWSQSVGIDSVILVSSSPAHARYDSQIKSRSQLRYLLTGPASSRTEREFEELHWKQFESKPASGIEMLSSPQNSHEDDNAADFAGTTFVKQLFSLCQKNSSNLTALIQFCDEGNNIPDAQNLATSLNQWTKWFTRDNEPSNFVWKHPSTWSHLFGGPPPRTLF